MGLVDFAFRFVRKTREKRKIAHLPAAFSPRRVIDIGCGMYPFPEFVFPEVLTLYADFDAQNNPTERMGRRGTFCRVDVEHLPFADGAFDFVHCSNVLEHVADPAQAFNELRRIAAHGYIECPSAFRENVICHTGAHRWIVSFSPEGVSACKPKETRFLGFKLLPATWIYRLLVRVRICWKVFDFVLSDCFGLMYRHFSF